MKRMYSIWAWTLCVCLAACEGREPVSVEQGPTPVELPPKPAESPPKPAEPPPKPAEPPSKPAEPNAWTQALARRAAIVPTPEACPHMFLPSLTPVAAPRVQAKNSARRVQRMRGKIARAEVIELSTNRVLFELDEQALASLRETPEDPLIDWDPDERPMVELMWEIGLLLYVGDDPVPFLGFLFHDDLLYFVDEADPWDPAVFDENEDFRAVYGIPVDVGVRMALERRLGPRNFDMNTTRKELGKEAARCGRVAARSDAPFPDLPAAVVEP